MQNNADQAADHGTVNADVLQIAADAQFQFTDQFHVIPLFYGIGNMMGDGVAHPREPNETNNRSPSVVGDPAA